MTAFLWYIAGKAFSGTGGNGGQPDETDAVYPKNVYPNKFYPQNRSS